MIRSGHLLALCIVGLALPWRGAADAPRVEPVEIFVPVDLAKDAPVVEVDRGVRLRLLIEGAGAHELHLHGYDISVDAKDGAAAVIEFDPLHSGRFAIVAHGVEDVLGRGEKPIAYIEVRER